MSLKENLRRLRKENRFSLEGLAKEANMSKAYLWQLEKEDGKEPSGEILYRLASVLDTSIEELLGKPRLGVTPVSPCSTCPFTPTVAAVLALMGHDWLRAEEHRRKGHMAAIHHQGGEIPETTKEAYLLISSLKEKLENEMRKGEKTGDSS